MVVVGTEREYASRAPSAELANRLVSEALRRVPHLPGCASGGGFSPWGRMYLDVGGRPELASIESDDPDEVLRSILIGEMLYREAARQLGIELIRSNVDYRGATGACHYNVSCTIDRNTMYDQLVPLLAALVVLGAGGLVPDESGVVFSLSPRCSSFIRKPISLSTDRERGLCHARNEPLARSYWRAHIPGMDTTCSHRATWLRLAMLAGAVWAIENGARPAEIVRLKDAIAAMRLFCSDLTLTGTALTVFHMRVTAIDILMIYLNAIRSKITRRDSPDWLALACQRMQRVLDLIRANPRAVTCVDWCIKLSLFQDWAWSQHAIEWDELPRLSLAEVAPLRQELTELDLRFGSLNPPGLFDQLDEQDVYDHRVAGVSDTICIDDLPMRGRAAARARQIVRLCGTPGACCEWDGVFDGHGRVLRLPDPESTNADWSKEEPDLNLRRSLGLQAARMLQSLHWRAGGR
jgi:hypothetical protein